MSIWAGGAEKVLQPLDRLAIALVLLLSLLIGLLLWFGGTTAPRVREFSWQDKTIGARDTAFVLTFNRPMDRQSVVDNLAIVPSLPQPGKVSWSGQRLVYTLPMPIPYGTMFELRLREARDRFEAGQPLQPFVGRFRSRDRAFAYIGIEGKEAGRLILYNLTQARKVVLTSPELTVLDFKPYPEGNRILFSAAERSQPTKDSATPKQNLLDLQLYTVTTGIQPQPPGQPKPKPEPAGEIDRVLDNVEYQNLKFDLSPDGQIIIVQRLDKSNPSNYGLWMLKPNAEPQPLDNKPGGDFLIAPDSASLAITQGQGVAILPLEAQADPLDFLPAFGTILDFAQDGSAAAMVKFNTDYTRSLFLVNNQGIQKELLKTTGSILSAQFDPQKESLYCLMTELIPGETFQEQPYLEVIDLKTATRTKLLKLPDSRDIQFSLSPDGLAILLDRPIPKPNSAPAQADDLWSSTGEVIATSQLWILPLNSQTSESGKRERLPPDPLPFPGIYPRWLP